jgi:hypothetical protein
MLSIDDGPQTVNLNPEEVRIFDEISLEAPARKPKPKAPRPPTYSKKAVAPEQQFDDGLDMFTNPNKRFTPAAPPPEEYDGGEEDGPETFPMGPEQGQTGFSQPSEGYKTIEDEKADLLNKINRLNKKGIQSSQRLTIYSDIEEIRTEYKRMMYSIEVDRSVKFQRRMLIACVTGLEFLNEKFDPFDLELNGWSQSCMENIDDYDGVFEELYNKYKTKVSMAPEVKLIFMLGGSAMMFHLTNTMMKAAVPNIAQTVKNNPDIMKTMMDALSRGQGAGPAAAEPPKPGLREMRGPGMDFSSLMGMMGPPPPLNTRPTVNDEADSISDIVSLSETKEIPEATGSKKTGRKKKEVSI